MLGISFHDTDVSGEHGGDGEEEKQIVGDNGVGNDPALQRYRQHGARPYRLHIVLQDAAHVPDDQHHRECTS